MASGGERREGEQAMMDVDQKPDGHELLTAILVKMDEQAQEQARKADEQARYLANTIRNSLSVVKLEAQQYTNEVCDGVKRELLQEVQGLKDAVLGLRG